jgi:hypothetical protein
MHRAIWRDELVCLRAGGIGGGKNGSGENREDKGARHGAHPSNR